MNNQPQIIKWATDFLVSKGYSIQLSPFIVLSTPWSNVIRFSTSKGNFYLKQTPPTLFLEPKIIQFLADQLQAHVAFIIAINNEHHCFLMKDAGQTLREYLKTDFQPDLMCQAIKQFTSMQRSAEKHIEPLLAMGVTDWRLDKLPLLYDQLINQTELLKEDGITDQELQLMRDLSPKFAAQCKLLAQYQIPETMVQTDFNTNNILIDANTKQMTSIDLGEILIAHPFLSLINFLSKAIELHGVKELDQTYNKLQAVGLENWLDLVPNDQLLEAFNLAKKLWSICSALGAYRLMNDVDPQAFKAFYADKSSRFNQHFKQYIQFGQYD